MSTSYLIMSGSEFKAWLDGYMEALEGRLTKKHVKRIQKQVAKVHSCHCHSHWWCHSSDSWTGTTVSPTWTYGATTVTPSDTVDGTNTVYFTGLTQ